MDSKLFSFNSKVVILFLFPLGMEEISKAYIVNINLFSFVKHI